MAIDDRHARRSAAPDGGSWSDDITLPGASFRNDLLPAKVSYSFTSLASVQGLIQYNRQTSTISSNIRLALLNRSGTGFFVVYNDRRDTSPGTAVELLGYHLSRRACLHLGRARCAAVS